MVSQFKLSDIAVDVVLKDVKNIHLSVRPPSGRVRIVAPLRTSPDAIRLFAISKLDWIKQQRRKLRQQERETPLEYLDRESHSVWGRRYLLTISEREQAPSIDLKQSRILLQVRPGTDEHKRRALVERWYREQLKKAVPPLLAKWQPLMDVKVASKVPTPTREGMASAVVSTKAEDRASGGPPWGTRNGDLRHRWDDVRRVSPGRVQSEIENLGSHPQRTAIRARSRCGPSSPPPSLASFAGSGEPDRSEAKVLASLNHPNIWSGPPGQGRSSRPCRSSSRAPARMP